MGLVVVTWDYSANSGSAYGIPLRYSGHGGWRRGLSRLAEHACLDPIDAAQAPRADDGAFGKLRLHRAIRPKQIRREGHMGARALHEAAGLLPR